MGQRYLRYEVVPLAEFLADISQHWGESKSRVQRPDGRWVGCTALRLKTFYRSSTEPAGLVCISCGMSATHFAVESSPGTVSAHVNLYGMKNGVEVLFTHDHIIARGLGGVDDLTNSQTMCSPCNSNKSKVEGKEVNRRRKNLMNTTEKLMTKFDYKVEHKYDGCYITLSRLEDGAERVLYMASGKGIGVMESCMDLITNDQADEYFPKVRREKVVKEEKVPSKEKAKTVKAPKLPKEPKREHFMYVFKDGVLNETNFAPEVIEKKFLATYNEYEIKLDEYNAYNAYKLTLGH